VLATALAIAPIELEIGFVFSIGKLERLSLPICVYRPPRLFQSLLALSRAHESVVGCGKTVTIPEIGQIRAIYEQVRTHDHSVLNLQRAFALYFELKDLPHFSPLQILGYFAILELILTHQPNAEDRCDSITRQITKKLALLNNRWSSPFDYAAFRPLTHEKLWSKMYAYRSAIAHGAEPDFGSGLAALHSAKHANALIGETVRKTLCHALVEPQLLADLHKC
jgi:hypothetical protein